MGQGIADFAAYFPIIVAGLVWGALHDPLMIAMSGFLALLGLTRARWPLVVGAVVAIFLARAGISWSNRLAMGAVNPYATALAALAGVVAGLVFWSIGRLVSELWRALARAREPRSPPS